MHDQCIENGLGQIVDDSLDGGGSLLRLLLIGSLGSASEISPLSNTQDETTIQWASYLE